MDSDSAVTIEPLSLVDGFAETYTARRYGALVVTCNMTLP